MTEVAFDVPQGCNLKGAPALLETACRACGLRVSSRATRAGMPGSVYWLVKHGLRPGVLELTLWEAKRRVWATLPEGQRPEWIDEDLPRLQAAVAAALRATIA